MKAIKTLSSKYIKYQHKGIGRLIALINVLAVRRISLNASSDSIPAQQIGHFLRVNGLFTLFDPSLDERVRRRKSDELRMRRWGKQQSE